MDDESNVPVPVEREPSSPLVTDEGRTVIADQVVAKIAGIAVRDIDGVHDLGSGTARAVGALRERIPGSSSDLTQGVRVELGERQAAVDVSLVADYGVALVDLAGGVRKHVIEAIESMTGLEVTEVNIRVEDLHLEGDTSEEKSRVE